ncbi:uncharacterized protein LOC107177858 [Citrus sinensis]|uniref:uncharacterized protein LOC107177858 n=1 Tax=Citrus sinensis TaxID=2711 RepID=UPI0007639746|nr:uncharacterized protein LOC107177858 [Citrus sinensis]
MWMLDLPEKIKIFMWRVIKNILPTAENLWKRKSLQDSICQRCKKEVETIKHVLVECKAARKVWELALLPLQSHSEQSQDFLRRKLEPKISAAKAKSVLEAYQRVRKAESAKVSPDRRANQQRWMPPPENVLKLNVDAAINNKDQVTGLGAVIRNSDGLVIVAGIKQAQLREGVSFAEAEAIQWGLQVAKKAAISNLIVETNCKEVTELINNTKAKLALRNDSAAIWLGNFPADVQNVLNSVVHLE